MPEFRYEVRTDRGARDVGVLTAESETDAARTLRRGGNTILSIREGAEEAASPYVAKPRRIRRDDVIFFANQLAVMVDTGVPLTEALRSILEETEHTGLRAVLQDLYDQVTAGVEFSAALESHPKVFGKLFVSLMRASEASGTMGQMLQRVSDYLMQERDVRKQVKGAMVYPLCMLGFCVTVVVAILVFVLPRFERIYAGKGAVLPAPTRILLAISNGLVNYWPAVLGGAVALTVGLYFYFRSESGRTLLDSIRINTPVIGSMYRKSCLARSMRTMATMVSSGVSMLDGLAITAEVSGNQFYRRIWYDVAERVKEGSTLSDHLRTCPLVPHTVTQMVSAGERTGRLGNVMNRIADYCEDDLRVAVKAVTSMIEPAMIIVMGLVIGGIAMALLLPVFNISRIMTQT